MNYLPLTSFTVIAADTVSKSQSLEERRCSQRLRTVYRVARVATEGDEGLARVLNISDGGMLLSLSVAIQVGDHIRVDLAEHSSFNARVVWRDGAQCGVSLFEPIDSAHTLRALGAEHNLPGRRPLRLSLKKSLVVSSEVGLHLAALRDVSQRGCKVTHDGRFRAGLAVKVTLAPGLERRGVVRWLNDNVAGIELTDLLTVEELGSVRGL